MDEVSSIIDRLGGAESIAGRFGISAKAIEMWGRRGGIPGRWHIPLLRLADERGVPLSLNELSRATCAALEEARQ